MPGILGFDLETVPTAAARVGRLALTDEELLDKLAEEEKAGVAALEGSVTEAAKQASLNPRLGRILAAGMATGSDRTKVLYAKTEQEEAALVTELWATISRCDLLLTFRGQPFDIPFLRVRSWILGVEIPVDAGRVSKWMKKYTHWGGHVDLQGALGHWGSVRGSLDEWLHAFDLPTKPMSGADVFPALLRGEHDRIREYAGFDAAALFHLYDRVCRDLAL